MKRTTVVSLIVFGIILFGIHGGAFAADIHEAAKSGNLTQLKALLDKDPSLLYVQDEQGKTALHWATGRGQPEAMKLLLDTYGADVNVRNKNGGTPLHVAASQAQPQGVKLLIEHNADINARTSAGATPLHFAALKTKPGHLEAAKILLENKADVNAAMSNGATPLSMAAYSGNTKMVNLLRQYGAQGQTQGGSSRRRGFGRSLGGMGAE